MKPSKATVKSPPANVKPKRPSEGLSQPREPAHIDPPAPAKIPYVGLLVVNLEASPSADLEIRDALARIAQLTRFSMTTGGVKVGGIVSIPIANMTGADFIAALRSLKG